MNILLHNPIADLHGFYFLRFYFFVIIITTLSCYFHLKSFNNKNTSIPPIPTEPDPYEIAFLKGGDIQVVKLAFLKLIKLDYLEVTGGKISFKNRASSDLPLSDLESYLRDYCTPSKNYHDIYNTSINLPIIKEYCHSYAIKLEKYNLLNSTTIQKKLLAWNILGVSLLFSLGLYKIIVSLINGYTNVIFTAILMIISPVILINICTNVRITSNGIKYLKNLELAFKDLKKQSKQIISSDPKYLLLVGLFGVTSLAGTSYANGGNSEVGSSCSSGDTGSSCSSSSCGSGSCGGGGCGG